MRKSIRAALFACAVVSTLAFASTALAAYTSPKLVVASLTPQAAGSGGPVRIGAVVSNGDDPTARVAIYVPNGYQIATAAPGTKLGDVTATAAAADLGGAILPLTGELDAVDPNALTPTQKAGISLCLAGATATQTWVLHLTAAGQTLDVPMLVVPAAGPEATVGQAKLLVCLPPPDVPVGTPGRAQFGAKLLSATFGVSAITQPVAAGDLTWTSLFTPYNPGKGTVNAAGSVETQSIRHIPTQLKLNYTKKKVTTFRKVKGKRVKSVSTRVTFSLDGDRGRQGAYRSRRDLDRRSRQEGGRGERCVHVQGQVGDAHRDRRPAQGLGRADRRGTDEHRSLLRGSRRCGLRQVGDLRRTAVCRSDRVTLDAEGVGARRGLHEVEAVSYPGRCHVGTGQDRDLLVGGRRAREALVSRGNATARAPRVLRRALLDGRGRLDLLPRPDPPDGAGLGRPHAGRLRHAREGVRLDDPAPGEAGAGAT